jgi:hypothetical protein
LVKEKRPPNNLYYKTRPEQGVNNSPEFYARTYKRFIDAGILYRDQLSKMDPALVNAFKSIHLSEQPHIPTKSDRTNLEIVMFAQQSKDMARINRNFFNKKKS